MMIFDSSIGIDFRQTHLILTLLRRSFGKIRLADHGIYPLLSESQKEEREAQIINLVNTFISRHQIHKERISISIPREKAVVRFIRFPIATKENLRKVVEYETSKYTPFEKGEIYFDYFVLKEEKGWLHLFVVFVKKVEVDYCLSLLKKIGIQPISIQIPSTAALNLFFYNEGIKGEGPSVLFDVTDSFWEINIIQEKNLIESFHLALPSSLPSEEKRSRILNTLKGSGLDADSLSKSVFFVYGLSADEEMVTSFKETPQMKAVFPPPLNRIEVGKQASEPNKIYASIGLPLKGLAQTQWDLNLLPFEMRRKVRQIGKPLLIILISLTLILSLIWGGGVFSRYKKELNAINVEMKKRRPEVEAVEKLQKQKEELGKEIAEFDKIRAEDISKIEILRELTQLLPPTVWIWNLKYTGKEVEINGFADSASDLIPLLDKSPLFEKVEFSAPVTKERVTKASGASEKERFKIKMKLETRRAGS